MLRDSFTGGNGPQCSPLAPVFADLLSIYSPSTPPRSVLRAFAPEAPIDPPAEMDAPLPTWNEFAQDNPDEATCAIEDFVNEDADQLCDDWLEINDLLMAGKIDEARKIAAVWSRQIMEMRINAIEAACV